MVEDQTHKTYCAILKGRITEDYVRWKLQREGYKVAKLSRHAVNFKNKSSFVCLNKKLITKFILDNYKENREELILLLKQHIIGLPDFICLKDNKISFVEVKSNNVELRESQEKVFKILRDKGYEVKIMNVNVDLNIGEIRG